MDISASVVALMGSKGCVVEHFYDRLFSQHPELQRHFENLDMRVQASMLTVALASVEAYYSQRFPATEHYLKVLGHRHFHEGVQLDDYPKFQTALVETLEEFFGDEWQPDLARQWSEALELAIKTMQEGYQQTYTL